MALAAREGFVIAAAHLARGRRPSADEILDHAVGIGMVDVEAVEFAIGGQVDAGLALNVENHARGVEHAPARSAAPPASRGRGKSLR